MINETILAIIIAFAVSAILCPVVIPFLHKLKFGQQVREDGPQAHLKKQGTPTMGGLVFLTAVVITSLLYIREYPRIIPVLFMTVGFGVIGFLDDYIKIVMKRSEGLNPVQKLIGQFIIWYAPVRWEPPCWFHLPADLNMESIWILAFCSSRLCSLLCSAPTTA